MTIEERIAKLEYHVRNFRIVVTGDAIVFGAFGSIPESRDTGDRIFHLEKSVDNFSLTGDVNIEVSGNFSEGYSIQ